MSKMEFLELRLHDGIKGRCILENEDTTHTASIELAYTDKQRVNVIQGYVKKMKTYFALRR